MEKKYHFFWKGKLSNWTASTFKVNGIVYNCGEQYMMHQKAIGFKDFETAKLIMETKIPRDQKALGRKVKDYNDEAWDAVRYDVVKRGLRERFQQNPDLKEYLISLKDYQLVEASPYDRIWGIGYEADEAMDNIDNWGQNLLGKILTELANELV